MFLHDLGLALRSLRRNPVLSLLMVVAIAAGIAASMVTLSLYNGRSGNPIWWKADELYAVTLDTRDEESGAYDRFQRHPEYPPFQLTYRDATALYRSDIPTRSVIMYRSFAVLAPQKPGEKPFASLSRVTTADFFSMFDVPFLYGSGWTRADDETPAPVVVLSRYVNQKLFNGENSVGRTVTIGERQFRIVGVIDSWAPIPKFYDLNNNGFDLPENIFLPFGWMEVMQLPSSGNTSCVRQSAKIRGFRDLLTQDCVWLQFWAELPTPEHRERYRRFVDQYATEQKQYGRFPRPLNNRVVDVDGWLAMNDVIGDDTRMMVSAALLFLVVCVLNTIGLMLAKFLKAAPVTGLRRALGASRRDVMRQHLLEVVFVGLIGGAVGLLLTLGGLRILRVYAFQPFPGMDDNPARVAMQQSLTHVDMKMFAVALLLSLFAGVMAGLYPAWRISRLAPSTFLKTQ